MIYSQATVSITERRGWGWGMSFCTPSIFCDLGPTSYMRSPRRSREGDLLGFGADNEKKLPTQPRIAQDLSKSNVVTITEDR
jgi:hypothetical protein